jgi:hypothetical protein
MIIVMVETRPVVLWLPRQKGCLHKAGAEEVKTGNGIVPLLHKGGEVKSFLSQSFLCFL